jgi:hypothetical protein
MKTEFGEQKRVGDQTTDHRQEVAPNGNKKLPEALNRSKAYRQDEQTFSEATDLPRETKLSAQQRQKAAAWIKNHATRGCPICDTTPWRIYEEVVEMGPKDVFLGGPAAYPAVVFMCTGCGYMMPFNAFLIGVMTKPNQDPRKMPEPQEIVHSDL